MCKAELPTQFALKSHDALTIMTSFFMTGTRVAICKRLTKFYVAKGCSSLFGSLGDRNIKDDFAEL